MKLIKLNIVGLSYSQFKSGAYALFLEEDNGLRKLSIVIGACEAQAIAIGLDTKIIIASGEYFNKFSETDFTIQALITINSSLVIPGFLGTPDVINKTSLLEVLGQAFVTPITFDLKPSVEVV